MWTALVHIYSKNSSIVYIYYITKQKQLFRLYNPYLFNNNQEKEYNMKIPELLQVSSTSYVNPQNISTFKDYGKRIEISTLGGSVIRIEGEWVEPTRNAILQQISDETTKDTTVDYTTTILSEANVQDADFTEVPPKDLCISFPSCLDKQKADEYCIPGTNACYVPPIIQPVGFKENKGLEDLSADPDTSGNCDIRQYCCSSDCTPEDKEFNIPKCFNFMEEPEECGVCCIKDICEAIGGGSCPIQ